MVLKQLRYYDAWIREFFFIFFCFLYSNLIAWNWRKSFSNGARSKRKKKNMIVLYWMWRDRNVWQKKKYLLCSSLERLVIKYLFYVKIFCCWSHGILNNISISVCFIIGCLCHLKKYLQDIWSEYIGWHSIDNW